MRVQRSWILLAASLVVVAPSLGAVTSAQSDAAVATATTSFVTMTNMNSLLTDDVPREWWTPGGGSITVSGTRNEVIVDASGGLFNKGAILTFAAPVGEDLAVGTYTDALNASTRPDGSPGIDIKTDTGGNNLATVGSFVIRDIAFSSSDVVQKLDLSYSVIHDSGIVTNFGQVSINETQQDPRVLAIPTTIRFPRTYAGTDSPVVRVRYVNTGLTAVRVDGMKLAGVNPGQFGLWRGDCVGTRLAPNATCVARVRFTPAVGRTAPAKARLVEWDSSGRHVVALRGWLQPGYTSLRMTGDEGDYITGGKTYSFRPTNATLIATGSPSSARMFVTADGTTWIGQFWTVSVSELLQVGNYPDAVGGDNPPVGHPHLEVTSSNGSCTSTTGSFDVYEYRLNPVTGVLEAFSVTWTQYCDSKTEASYGSFAYHATSPAQPVPSGD